MTRFAAPLSLLFALAAAAACTAQQPSQAAAQEAAATEMPAPVATLDRPQVLEAQVVATYPHDPNAFTQGLLWHDGALYESTGQIGESKIRKVDLTSGKVLAEKSIPSGEFGEGMALVGKELVSLTWKDGIIHRWKMDGLKPVRSQEGYPYEGWGLTTLGDELIASDGSANLHVLDPDSYAVKRDIPVTLNGRPLRQLNELETVEGMILANVWMSPFIVAIEPATGKVRQLYDLRGIVQQVAASDPNAVLNGIAWDPTGKRLFVTGKRWPSLFEITLVPSDQMVQ
tara:strand:+ start:447 stop:1301 length:855 start_codon:yes stop_codon:yes gene_type:complete